MAETVQYYLEQMVPELEDLESKGLFNKLEIKSIVKKRTRFEYALKRRIARKADFLRYIEYEMNLETLRKKRKERLGHDEGEKATISDYAGNRRINFLFRRAVNKFKGDLQLWMQYIAYAKQTKSTNLLGDIFANAIQYHPTKPAIWIQAAAWEYEENANISAARTLMQRALRVNPECETLWHEYFRLELLYIEKIKVRRRILGIDESSEKEKEAALAEEQSKMDVDDESTIKLPVVTGEEVEDWNKEGEERKTVEKMKESTAEALQEGVNPILKGLLATIIYNNAIIAIPKNLSFRKTFVDIYRLFTDTEEGCEHVFETIRRDMGTEPEARAYLAERHLFTKITAVNSKPMGSNTASAASYVSVSDPEFVTALKACTDEFNTAVQEVPLPKMWELYVEFLSGWHDIVSEENLKLYLSKLMQRAFKTCQKSSIVSEKLYSLWIDYLCGQDDITKATAVAENAVKTLPQSATLWVTRIGLAQTTGVTDDSVENMYRQAMELNPASFVLWSAYNEWLVECWRNGTLSFEKVDEMYMDACSKVTTLLPSVTVETEDRNKVKDLILSSYVEWALEAKGISEARQVYKKIIHGFYPTTAFYQTCFRVESSQNDVEAMEYLFEMAARLNINKQELALSHISYLWSQNKFKKASHVYWKAAQEIKDKSAFEAQFQQIKEGHAFKGSLLPQDDSKK